jgi:tetratricopeptide (TPR) repeat protein
LAEDFSTAIKVALDSPWSYFYRAKCYRRHYKYYDKALADFNKALELDPNFIDAQKSLNELKRKMGDKTAGSDSKKRIRLI